MITLQSTTGARWLDANFELIEAVAHRGNGLVDLWEASRVRLDSNKPNTDEIIDILFPLECSALLRLDSSSFRNTRPKTLVQAA